MIYNMQSFEKMRENGEKLEKQKMHWLAFYKSNSRYENADMNVLSFIANISFFPDMEFRENDAISHLFSSGYCYYFANMLKLAFGRGEVCWSVGRGHIVWVDENEIAYDIDGVYEDYEELRDVSYLGTTLVDFMHNGKTWTSNDSAFIKHCKEKDVFELVEIANIWTSIPKQELAAYDQTNLTLPEVAIDYWRRYTTTN